MPRIPTYQAQENISVGSVSPQADANAFGAAGLDRVGQGLANLGGDLADIAYQQKRVAERKKLEDERQWVGQSSLQLDRVLAEFHANEDNQAKPTFATDFDEFAKKQMAEYGKAAPSSRAAKEFSLRAGGISGNYYNSALRTAERTRLVNQRVAFEEQTGNALLSYRNNVKAGTPNADDMLAGNMRQILDDIDRTFAGRPEAKRVAQSHLIKESVLALSGHDPEFAKEVLDSASFIEEPLRKSLTAHIEAEQKTGTATARTQAELMMKHALEEGERGNVIPIIDESIVKDALGKDGGEAALLKFNEAARISNEANFIVADLSDKNAGYQQRKLAEMSQTKNVNAVAAASQRLEKIQRQQEKNPGGFMRSHNEEVQKAYGQVALQPDALKQQFLNMADATSLKYQGYPPADATPEEAAKYLRLPTGLRHIMDEDEARTEGARLMQGSLTDQTKAINEFVARYDKAHQYIAFNDLKKFAGIPPELQAAILMNGETYQNKYMQSALNKDNLAKLTPEKQSEFGEVLDGDAQWQLFRRSLLADGQRIPEVEGWRSGAIAYANALSLEGNSPKDATKKALEHMITRKLGFPTVHGEPVMVSKAREDGTYRDDSEINDYGRRLQMALRGVDTRQIKTEDDNGVPYFLTLPALREGDVLGQQHLRDIITSQGFYRPEPDGQSVTLYLLDSDGVEFQVRDKNNRPLEIALDDLPDFITPMEFRVKEHAEIREENGKQRTVIVPEGTEMRNVKETPSSYYDIETKEGYGKSATYKTNWPTMGGFWKNQRKPIPPRFKDLK
jgi:hypothetical protein